MFSYCLCSMQHFSSFGFVVIVSWSLGFLLVGLSQYCSFLDAACQPIRSDEMYWVQPVGTHFSLEVYCRLSFVDFLSFPFHISLFFFACNGGSSTYIHLSIACIAQIIRKILIAYFLA